MNNRENRVRLKDHELSLIEMILKGMTVTEAAPELGISTKAALKRLDAIRAQFSCRTTAQLAATMVWEGYILMPERHNWYEDKAEQKAA